MNGNGDGPTSRNSAILPPVVTRRQGYRLPSSPPTAPIAPPFIASVRSTPIMDLVPAEMEAPVQANVQEEAVEEMAWDSMSDEGVVEPVFEADTSAVLEELTAQAAKEREEFPLEAFIVPEQAERVPNGLEGKRIPPAPEATPLSSLAERLEKLSHKLRVEDTDAVVRRLAAGDRLDTLLAGLVAGFLAGSSDKS
jgi:hypothetical protein